MDIVERKHKRLLFVGSLKEQNAAPETLLAAEIVIGAINDWRKLVKRRAWNGEETYKNNFNELRQFFTGEWCAFLMQDFDIEPERILEILEAELAEAKVREENKQRKKTKGR